MKSKRLKEKLWFNIFIRVAVIFAVFVLILCLSNVGLLVKFFSLKEKSSLRERLITVSQLDIEDTSSVSSTLSEIREKYNFDVEIYKSNGKILYTTHGSQMMDYFSSGDSRFNMIHEPMKASKVEDMGDGITYAEASRHFDNNEYLMCYKEISEGTYAEVRIQRQLISTSAGIANEFIIIVSIVCFFLSILWVLYFARSFSQPISKMNEITKDMAELNFERRLKVGKSDEIGQLASSINNMSESLSSALTELKQSNAKLRDEIELERQLDVMRRGFVANVSHELKTPIAIISGYAEGLKMNINAESKESYCNTIIDESSRMNRLVLSILELSKYESGQIPINYTDFDVSIMCDDMLKRLFKDKNMTTENLVPRDTFIHADPVQIEQVLKSYLENAASHTNDGGTVRTYIEQRQNCLRINVYNSGSHIDDDVMPQIWQSFYRGDKSHKRDSSRFGLGLSIVSAIMKLHSHACGVYNTDSGVCFWFEVDHSEKINDTKEDV